MRLTIDKNDLDAFRYVCVVHNLRLSSIPGDQPGIVDISIRHRNGADISAALGVCLGRQVEVRRDLELTNKRIQEHELLQPQPNNVLIHVEPYVDEIP